MLILGCSIIATLVIINVHFRSPQTHQMGKWERLDEEERESDMQADWKFTAMVIDRFSLFLFTILIGATTALVFLSTPRLFVASPVF
ncbi:hypothetical protein ANCDUO_13976 [Ancylostoma duodenale]|uniref:Neurotransmitter-gated ion-channel transmembrane domain-containing protein n=1 Tax=Ancylostoma duodenale TaxID=51022 RepID=A0A0C2GFH7_9BILA|nr:hypothetical protein ANCDUO_13976 [Ancylostoma duodenale]